MPDLQKGADERFSEQALAEVTRVDRDHVVAALRQILEGEITRPHVGRRRPDHRDRFHAVENLADVIVGVGVMVHFKIPSSSWRGARSKDAAPPERAQMRSSGDKGHLSCHFGSRFSMKAPMPSSASRAIMFSVIT